MRVEATSYGLIHATGDVEMTEFTPVIPQRPVTGTAMVTLPPESAIAGLGNVDGRRLLALASAHERA
jgi:hypothetical protein